MDKIKLQNYIILILTTLVAFVLLLPVLCLLYFLGS